MNSIYANPVILTPRLLPGDSIRLLAELKKIPSWKAYEERLKQMETASDKSDQQELRTVKFRRLINTLEMIVLEKNLPLFAASEIVARYQQMLALEDSTLGSAAGGR